MRHCCLHSDHYRPIALYVVNVSLHTVPHTVAQYYVNNNTPLCYKHPATLLYAFPHSHSQHVTPPADMPTMLSSKGQSLQPVLQQDRNYRTTFAGCRTSQLGRKVTGEEGPATELRPVTHTILHVPSQIFSHMNPELVTILHVPSPLCAELNTSIYLTYKAL